MVSLSVGDGIQDIMESCAEGQHPILIARSIMLRQRSESEDGPLPTGDTIGAIPAKFHKLFVLQLRQHRPKQVRVAEHNDYPAVRISSVHN